MATTKFKGQPVKVIGEFIKVGAVAPDFELVKTDLSSFSLKELNGKNVILNIFRKHSINSPFHSKNVILLL
jgi:thiol peroxidase